MTYATDYIANALKAAREAEGLSQQKLSAKSGIPQSHISKIEAGAVDLRLSSLITLARVLGLEITLVDRNAVSAVQSIARTSARGAFPDDKSARQARKILKRLQKTIASLPISTAKEVSQLQQLLRELQHFHLVTPSMNKALRAADGATNAFKNGTGNMDAIRQALLQLQNQRNALFHASVNLPPIASARPAYSLDEEDIEDADG
jgi:transcriptional regulator with XRE-family HTH domain